MLKLILALQLFFLFLIRCFRISVLSEKHAYVSIIPYAAKASGHSVSVTAPGGN